MQSYKGGCHCGRVRFRVSGDLAHAPRRRRPRVDRAHGVRRTPLGGSDGHATGASWL